MGKYNQDKPLKIYSQQKHAVRIMYNKDRLLHTRELFKSIFEKSCFHASN